MKRLCFLSPDINHARRTVDDHKANGIPEKHIYALAKYGVDLEDLPDAGPESDDFLAAYKRGIEFGGIAGLLAGLSTLAFPPSGIIVGGGLGLLMGLWGAGLGELLTGIAGAAFPSSRLQSFESAIDKGQILVMADAPKDQVEHYGALIKRHDPAVNIEDIEPSAPLIPK